MATSTVIGSGSTRNNSGVAYKANSRTTSLLHNITAGYSPAVPRVVPKDVAFTSKAVSAGAFAYEGNRPIAKRHSTTIGGVANTTLRSGAADWGFTKNFANFDITFKTYRVTTAIRGNNAFHPISGVFISAVTNATDTFVFDNEGSVSRTNAGEYQAKGGKPNPVLYDYLTKKNG